MEYKEVNLIRRIDEVTITVVDLDYLSAYDVGNLESGQDYYRMPYRGRRPDTAPLPGTIEPEQVITDHYHQTLNFIRDHIINRDNEMELVIEDGTQIRAAGLRNQFRNQSGRELPISVTYRADEVDSARYATPINSDLLQDHHPSLTLTPKQRITGKHPISHRRRFPILNEDPEI